MKSFNTTIKNLFRMDTEKTNPASNFSGDSPEDRKLVIPLYQREYKWEKEHIEALLNDIYKRDKFLGIIILDEKTPNYEIVDGQQRITTLFLILAALYNLYYDETDDQDTVNSILMPYGPSFTLINDSVGSFLKNDNRRYVIEFSGADPYQQERTFVDSFKIIEGHLAAKVKDKDTGNTQLYMVKEILDKLLDCEVLVLIGDEDRRQNNPVERLFLDINEKGKQLDAEDVFKGYCFQIVDVSRHDDFKRSWCEFKEVAIEACKYGYDDVNDYLYRFILLEDEKNKAYTKVLKHRKTGIHYLEGKTQSAVKSLITKMISFGNAINQFYENINKADYQFADICPNSVPHNNDHNDHNDLKLIFSNMLKKEVDEIPKLSVLYFIFHLKTQPELSNALSHEQFMRIVTNLYGYVNLFEMAIVRKGQDTIDRELISILGDTHLVAEEKIRKVIEHSKKKREEIAEVFTIADTLKVEKADFIYSIIDNLSLDGPHHIPRFSIIYPNNSQYNHEHLIINDNDMIEWCKSREERGVKIPIKDIRSDYRALKKRFSNYLVLDHDLNEELESRDIIWKIEHINEWYSDKPMHEHVRVFIEHITSLESYRVLEEYKNGFDWEDIDNQLEELKPAYEKFLDEFFGLESTQVLFDKLNESFDSAFSRQTTS